VKGGQHLPKHLKPQPEDLARFWLQAKYESKNFKTFHLYFLAKPT
jgi:hypothetical protein